MVQKHVPVTKKGSGCAGIGKKKLPVFELKNTVLARNVFLRVRKHEFIVGRPADNATPRIDQKFKRHSGTQSLLTENF